MSLASKAKLCTSLAVFGLLTSFTADSQGAKIDLRLDVNYTGGAPSAGGTWQLFAKTDSSGLFSLSTPISGINAAVTNELPRGRVNGGASDNAGFATFVNNNLGSTRQLYFAQIVTPGGAGQQGVFYGVGTLDNGSPNFPGKQSGTAFLGPNITSLASLQKAPWANTDTLWATGVTVASGTFAAGATPGFGSGTIEGSLLSSVGTISTPGALNSNVSFTTLVRTNLGFGVATGDYTGNGVVDAADYSYWRDRLNQNVTPLTSADGNGDGVINAADYTVWANNYGSTATSSASALAIPEPNALAVVATAGLLAAGRRPRAGKAEQKGGIA